MRFSYLEPENMCAKYRIIQFQIIFAVSKFAHMYIIQIFRIKTYRIFIIIVDTRTNRITFVDVGNGRVFQ